MTAPRVHFREAGPADREAILALRRAVFPREDIEKQSTDFWDWEFRHGYAGPARMFVADAEGMIAAHFAFVPQHYTDGPGAVAVDVMTHPHFRRQRVFSELARFAAGELRRSFSTVTAFQIREAVLPGMIAGGWRPAHRAPVLLKLAPFRRAAVPVHPFTESHFGQVDRLLQSDGIRQPRTIDFLRWRYLRNPVWRYAFDGVFDNDQLSAFIISRPARLRGVRTLAIADAGARSDGTMSMRSLVEHACARANLRLAAALVTSEHPAYAILRRSGFFRGPHHFQLLVQQFREKAHQRSWSLSWGDSDHL